MHDLRIGLRGRELSDCNQLSRYALGVAIILLLMILIKFLHDFKHEWSTYENEPWKCLEKLSFIERRFTMCKLL